MANRRAFLAAGAAGLVAPISALSQQAAGASRSAGASTSKVRACLNTSTIRGQQLSITEQVDVAARAGYEGIEPWIRDLRQFEKDGGSLDSLKQRINNAGLRVESAIGFAKWIVDDADERDRGLVEMKADMELVAAIGGTRIAAPPIGMHGGDAPMLDLDKAAARYRDVLELGRTVGVVPQLEFWGPSKNLHKLEQAMYVATAAGHPDACLLPDIYHMFRGGSKFDSLELVAGGAIHCFHVNDYPGGRERAEYKDSDRVYPGDGVAPVARILAALIANGFEGALSLELFNKDYWRQDPNEVAARGLKSIRDAVAAAEELLVSDR